MYRLTYLLAVIVNYQPAKFTTKKLKTTMFIHQGFSKKEKFDIYNFS